MHFPQVPAKTFSLLFPLLHRLYGVDAPDLPIASMQSDVAFLLAEHSCQAHKQGQI